MSPSARESRTNSSIFLSRRMDLMVRTTFSRHRTGKPRTAQIFKVFPMEKLCRSKPEESRIQNSGTESVLRASKFNNPVVAIFDVLRTSDRHPPIVLLQPRLQLSSIFPNLGHDSMDQLPQLESAYIGLIDNSLFVMTPDRFPMVAFGSGRKKKLQIVEALLTDPLVELPSETDAITAARRKRREKAMREREYGCQDMTSLYTDRRCLVGMYRLESSDGDGPEMPMRRLIDGVPSIPVPWENVENPSNFRAADDALFWRSIAVAFVLGSVLGAGGLWFVPRKLRSRGYFRSRHGI
ncbi:hypothetical protein C8R43DRAFT_1020869 [Mycena crocata]|nr:hypothetical protein C8R43DRAFT_1020869 [Mycena crocata]